MTREEAKEMLPIMQAYAEGKTIQFRENINNMWETIIRPSFNKSPSAYRIKPEPRYRPFKTQEECWQEMLKHQPFGWLKNKKRESVILIGNVYMDKEVLIVWATNERDSNSASMVFNKYVFADGTPFGIREE